MMMMLMLMMSCITKQKFVVSTPTLYLFFAPYFIYLFFYFFFSFYFFIFVICGKIIAAVATFLVVRNKYKDFFMFIFFIRVS